jgi:hypothetical protein
VLRCYVRVVRGADSGKGGGDAGGAGAASSGGVAEPHYEMVVQAPTSLPYPLGPLPPCGSARRGDVLVAMAARRASKVSDCGQLDVSLAAARQAQGPLYLGTLLSSHNGLEHAFVALDDAQPDHPLCELAAVNLSMERVCRAVGPRRVRVCLPALERAGEEALTGAAEARAGSTREGRGPQQWVSVPHRLDRGGQSLSSSLRAACAVKRRRGGKHGLLAQHAGPLLLGHNKAPYWLPSINAFSLDFGGRVTLPSSKNFQLVVPSMPAQPESSAVALQFGKTAESPDLDVYSMDVAWPLSPLQALAISLSACACGQL